MSKHSHHGPSSTGHSNTTGSHHGHPSSGHSNIGISHHGHPSSGHSNVGISHRGHHASAPSNASVAQHRHHARHHDHHASVAAPPPIHRKPEPATHPTSKPWTSSFGSASSYVPPHAKPRQVKSKAQARSKPRASHFDPSYEWSIGDTRAEETREALLREAQERARIAHDRELAAVEAHRRVVEAICGMHRIVLVRVVWERLRDQPDPGGSMHARWAELRDLAIRVLSGDTIAYREALAECGCLVEVHAHVGKDGLIVDLSERSARVHVRAPLGDRVPEVSTARGSIMRTPAERLDVCQDYLCGLSLRVARELLAVLPLDEVVVDLWSVTAAPAGKRSSAAGYRDAPAPRAVNTRIASMRCARLVMDTIPWEVADASLVVEALPHTMDFVAGKGFAPVDSVA